MKNLRNLIGIVLAFAVATFALPTFAQQKTKLYELLYPSTMDAGWSGTITVGMRNVSPDGNSTIKSYSLTLPANVFVVDGTTPVIQAPFSGGSSPPVVVSQDRRTVTINDVSPPIKANDPTLGTLNLQMQVRTICTFNGGDWTANVRSGSSLGGQPFDPRYPQGLQSWQVTLGQPCATYTVTWATSGSGTVCAPTTGILSGGSATCSTVNAATGWTFKEWTGCDNYTPNSTTCTVNISNASKTATATFTENQYNITVIRNDAATTLSAGCSAKATYGADWTCTATNKPGYTFSSWSGCTETSGTTCTLKQTLTDKTVTVTFTQNQYTVAGEGSPTDKGTVTCETPRTYGQTSVCTAAPVSGYGVPSFSPNCTRSGTDPLKCTVASVTGDTTVTANFAPGGVVACSRTNGANLVTPFAYDPDDDKNFSGTPGWGIRRGANTDGADCVLVNTQVVFDGVNNIASITYDKSSLQKWSAKHVLVWTPDPVDTSGVSYKKLYLAWGTFGTPENPTDNPGTLQIGTNGLPTNDTWVPALACVEDPPVIVNNSLVYMSSMTPEQLEALLPVIPDVEPFSSSPWPQYQPGIKAKACLSASGSTSIGLSTDNPRRVLVQHWHKIVDQVDLWGGSR